MGTWHVQQAWCLLATRTDAPAQSAVDDTVPLSFLFTPKEGIG